MQIREWSADASSAFFEISERICIRGPYAHLRTRSILCSPNFEIDARNGEIRTLDFNPNGIGSRSID
jgi:hypothetical protein